MNPAISRTSPERSVESSGLSPATSSFALAAAIAVVFNTALAWVKDAYAPLNSLMKSMTGHHWITHGLADLVIFLALGVIFQKAHITEKMDPHRVIRIVVWATVAAALGLALWFVFF